MTVGESPTFWIGLDDTDEREHGCTTHDFNELLNHLSSSGFSIDDPRLVRLWPFAPNRTRGNAALAAAIRTEESARLESCINSWFLTRFSDLKKGDELHSAQPVLIMTMNQLPESIYWDTVTQFVGLSDRLNQLETIPHRVWSTPAGQGGIIGASAAIAWRGTHDFTWECTAWRQTEGERRVPPNIVENMSELYPSTFMNRDPNAGRSLIAPRTPCPVLYGIRGETKKGVEDAHNFLQQNGAEICSGYRVHRSNQATDDHLSDSVISHVNRVTILQGGHVVIESNQKLLSFSQGGDVNKLSQQLEEGDEIEWLGLQDFENSIHLERLRLIHGSRNRSRPYCNCGSRFKSQGRNQPLKCPDCGSMHPDEWVSEKIQSEWKEPPPAHRRHLSKPLSRKDKSED